MTILTYDGSWEGFLSGVFEWFRRGSGSASLRRETLDTLLFPVEAIATDAMKAARVERGMAKLGPDIPEMLYTAWLSQHEGIEDAVAGFMRIGFDEGIDPKIHALHPDVRAVDKAMRQVGWEAQRMRQFVRFVNVQGIFVADIEPQYNVLTLIADHFHGRFNDQRLMIRDLQRRIALVSETKGWWLLHLGEDEIPPLPQDGAYESLWRGYFKAIANPARKNVRLQQQFIPLRYRAHLTEFQDDIP